MNKSKIEKPIIFSAEMVRALLNTKPDVWPAEPVDDSKPFKSQTRRVIKPQPDTNITRKEFRALLSHGGKCIKNPYEAPYKPGDILWVRESFGIFNDEDEAVYLYYKADEGNPEKPKYFGKWKPSIHMPRGAARLFLEVKSVRVERLQDITEADAAAEGIGLNWLRHWIEKNYKEPEEDAHWIKDFYHDYDQSLSFCRKCGEAEVKILKREAKKEGATPSQVDDIFLDGGYDIQEDDTPTHCENCGKPLTFTASEGALEYELIHYSEHGLTKNDAYFLDQIDDDDLQSIKSFNKICFRTFWDSLNAKRGHSWKSNPWVWVYEFMRTGRK